MKRFILQLGIIMIAMIMFIGCSSGDNESEDLSDDSMEEVTENEDETDEPEEEVKLNDDDYDPEDYQDLSIGETAEIQDYMVSGLHYEITLNKVESMDMIDDQEPIGDFIVLAEVTLKTLHEEETMDVRSSLSPGFGNQAPLNSVYLDEESDADLVEELNLMQGEIEPGEEITGTYLFDVEEDDEYYFAYHDKMVTFASWIVSFDEIE